MNEQQIPAKPTNKFDSQYFEAGHIIGGKYRVISVLGKGGMGTVYHVHHMFLDTEFALKILDKKRVFDELQVKRFQTEAKAANALDHPNLIKVHDYGLSDDDQPYLVMDFINGLTLTDYLKIHGQLSEKQALPIFEQICAGLQYAHDKNLVHRDIKPSNIMIVNENDFGKTEVVKILDFGIAKYTDSESGQMQNLTQTGEIFGSPLYMSPEQCNGGEIDSRSDIYSLGCVYFEVLTGTPPHVGTTALRTMSLHQSESAPKLSEASLGKQFSEDIERTIQKMLEKDPNKRQRNLEQVLRELKTSVRQKQDGQPVKPVLQKNITANKKLSMTVFSFCSFVCLVIISTVLTTIAISEHRQEVLKSVVRNLTPPEPGKGVTEFEIANDMKNSAKEVDKVIKEQQTLQAAYKPGTEIRSKIEDTNSIQKRKFLLPAISIGQITNHYAQSLSGGKLRLFESEMSNTVMAPTGQPLTIHLRGDLYPEIFKYPELIDRVDPAEFEELAVNGNQNVKQKELQAGVNKFLASASKWKLLKSLALYSVPLDEQSLKLIDGMPLDNLLLSNVTVDTKMLAESAVLTRVQSAAFAQMKIDDLIPTLGKSENLRRLELISDNFEPDNFENLKYAPQLSVLIIEGKAKVGTIARLKELSHLTSLYIKHIDIEPSDIPELAKCSSLKRIQLSKHFTEAYLGRARRDSRIVFIKD